MAEDTKPSEEAVATLAEDAKDEPKASAPKPRAKKVAETKEDDDVSEEDKALLDFASRPESEQNRIVRDVARKAVVTPQTGAIDTPQVSEEDLQHRFSHRAPEGYEQPVFPHPQVN